MADVRYAKQISVSHCKHGSIHIVLLDENGEVFAAVTMDPAQAADLTADLIGEVEAAAKILGVDIDADGTRSIN